MKYSQILFLSFIQIRYCFVKPILGCQNQLNDECWKCKDGWNLISGLHFCFPNCGDKIITYNEECDDGNNIPFDGCYNCRFQCDSKCKNCLFGKCQDLANNDEQQIVNCDTYYSDFGIYYDLNYQSCLAKFFDGIINLNEQCDDINYLQQNKFYLNFYQCPLNCLNCNNGICMQCVNGYQLNKNQCKSYCGDQIITQDEQCDDGNSIQLDGCHNCQFNCQQGCLDCLNNNYCIKCLDGWNQNNGQCEQICNDNQLAILSIEQCDDQSDQYCIDCQIQCSMESCVQCYKFKCLQCEKPYSLINGQCIPFCGDRMIYQSTEQCDDGNNIQHDGCYDCQFECLEGCQKCGQNLYCTQCDSDSNYILDNGECQKKELPNQDGEKSDDLVFDISIACARNELLINFECVNQCGNGVIDYKFETCDDGNINGGDGCSFDCQIEKFYTCKNNDNQMSQCYYIPQPFMILTNLSAKRSSIQKVQITFNEEVKINQQYLIENIMQLTVTPNIETIIIIKPITNISLTPSNASYLIEIQFSQQIENPKLKVEILESTIYSDQGQTLQEPVKNIGLGEPFILSKQIQLKADEITEVNNVMIFSIITGNLALLLNLLDLLQQLSYLRYIQYQFPSHLKQFLDTYSTISLKPLLDQLKIDELLAKLNGGNIPFVGSYKNNRQSTEINQLNQFYLLNAKGCYFSFFISLGTYKFCSIIASDSFQLFLTNKILQNKSFSKKKMKTIYNLNQNVRNKCSAIKRNYFYTGLFQSYFAVMHQLLFSSFLQFPHYSFNTWLDVFNSIYAILSLTLIIYVAFISFSLPTKLNKKVFRHKFFFDDINKNYWPLYFKFFYMFKIFAYIFFIVFCMSYSEVQSLLLSAQSSLFLFYLLKYQPYKQKLDQLKLILREIMLLLITGSFLAYRFQLNYDLLLLFGWIHISMILIIMIGTILIDIYKQILDFYAAYQKQKRIEKLKQQVKYKTNSPQIFDQEDQNDFPIKR